MVRGWARSPCLMNEICESNELLDGCASESIRWGAPLWVGPPDLEERAGVRAAPAASRASRLAVRRALYSCPWVPYAVCCALAAYPGWKDDKVREKRTAVGPSRKRVRALARRL